MSTSQWWVWKADKLQTPSTSPTPSVTGAEDVTPDHPVSTATPLSALRVVSWVSATEVAYTDTHDPLSIKAIAGITQTAGQPGGSVLICASGFLTDSNWNWQAGKSVMCGPNGVLTQVWNPAWPNVAIVGYALTAKTLLVRLRDSIKQQAT